MARTANTKPRVYASWEQTKDKQHTRKVFAVALTGHDARRMLANREHWASTHAMQRHYGEWRGPLFVGAIVVGKWERTIAL